MKNILYAFLLICFTQSCSLSPCGSTPEAFIQKMQSLVDTVSEKKKDLSEEEWKSYDAQLDKLTSECYKEHEAEMTVQQQKSFLLLTTRYAYQRGTGGLKGLFNRGKKELENLKNELNEIDGKELDDLINDVSKDVKDWKKDLEEILKD